METIKQWFNNPTTRTAVIIAMLIPLAIIYFMKINVFALNPLKKKAKRTYARTKRRVRKAYQRDFRTYPRARRTKYRSVRSRRAKRRR